MAPARHGFDNQRLVARGLDAVRLAGIHVQETEPGLPLEHQEFLGLGVVVMATACHARPGGEETELARMLGAQHLGEHAAFVTVADDRIGEIR